MQEETNPLLRRVAHEKPTQPEYEPSQLWLLPVLLRSRERYYDDAVAAVRKSIDDGWSTHGHLYESRKDYEESSYVRALWQYASPYWWGLNDIIGFIDVRVNLSKPAVEASVFLTHKRPSRSLSHKKFVYRAREDVELIGGQTNDDLCPKLDEAITRLRNGELLRRRYVDLEAWRRVLYNTNVMAIVLGDIDRLSSQ